MGQCLAVGWTEEQFWRSTYKAVFNLLYTVQKNKEALIRERWEQMRVMCHYIMIAPHSRPNNNGNIFSLPWDNEDTGIKVETEEERIKREIYFEKLDKLMREKHASE